MRPLVLTSRACFLSVRRHQLLITDYINRTESTHAARHLPFDTVILYRAGGSISFEATRFLASQGVPVVHLNWDGNQTAETLPPRPISGKLRLAQYQASLDTRRAAIIATALVKEKVSKSIALLEFLKRRYPSIDAARVASVRQSTWPMGFELHAAERYWLEFAKVVQAVHKGVSFPGRKSGSNNMGATDPINSVLNYGYAILEARVRLSLQKAGLDPEVGYLHSTMPGATPLVYDVMELSRWVVDLSVVELLESGKLRGRSFRTAADYKVFVTEGTASDLAHRLAQNFNRTVRIGNQNLRLETLTDLNVRKLVRFIEGSLSALDFSSPFAADYSQADADLASVILRMTVEERKRHGVSKTTLFYLRRRLQSGRPVRVYTKTNCKIHSG